MDYFRIRRKPGAREVAINEPPALAVTARNATGSPLGPNLTSTWLPPPRLLVQTNSQRRFGDHLMRQKRIGGVNPSEAGVAQETLVTC